jgi:hypothetical protein
MHLDAHVTGAGYAGWGVPVRSPATIVWTSNDVRVIRSHGTLAALHAAGSPSV